MNKEEGVVKVMKTTTTWESKCTLLEVMYSGDKYLIRKDYTRGEKSLRVDYAVDEDGPQITYLHKDGEMEVLVYNGGIGDGLTHFASEPAPEYSQELEDAMLRRLITLDRQYNEYNNTREE